MLTLFLALMVAMGTLGAAAEVQTSATVVGEYEKWGSTTMLEDFGLVAVRVGKDWGLMNVNGEIATEQSYTSFYVNTDDWYAQAVVREAEGINVKAILDADGKEISTEYYGWVDGLTDRWALGLVMEDAASEPYDHYVGYRVKQADIYYRDKLLCSLDRAQYKAGFYCYGDYLYLPDAVVDCNGVRTEITDEDYAYYRSFEYVWHSDRQAYWHWGSGQYAFVPGCTLTSDEVESALMYDGRGNIIDLQGNILFNSALLKDSSRKVLPLSQDKYFSMTGNVFGQAAEWYLFDVQGNVIAAGQDIGDRYDPTSILASGYQIYVDFDGFLRYSDAQGNAGCEFTLRSTAATEDSVNYNLPFIFYQNTETGKYTVISAAAGKLSVEFDEVMPYDHRGWAAGSRILGVKQNGKVGAIDMYGNTVIPFEYESIMMSEDGTMAVLDTKDSYVVYRIEYVDGAAAGAAEAERQAEEAVADADSDWHCDACDRENDMNFCPGCGAARPEEMTCEGCGYERPDVGYIFCPNCGQKF